MKLIFIYLFLFSFLLGNLDFSWAKSESISSRITFPQSIGQATLTSNKIIILDLRAEDAGSIGDSRLFYPPTHPQYQEILHHVGGLKPGETKPVPPWPKQDPESKPRSSTLKNRP